MLQSGLASAERVFEFLDAAEEPASAPAMVTSRAPVTGRATLKHAAASGTSREKPGLIEDFSLDAQPGQTVVIVGGLGRARPWWPCSCGSTRRLRPDSCWTALTNRDLTREEVRRRCFGMVLQEYLAVHRHRPGNVRHGRRTPPTRRSWRGPRRAPTTSIRTCWRPATTRRWTRRPRDFRAGRAEVPMIARAFLANPPSNPGR